MKMRTKYPQQREQWYSLMPKRFRLQSVRYGMGAGERKIVSIANRLSFYRRIENGLVYLYLQNKTFVPKKKYKIKNKEDKSMQARKFVPLTTKELRPQGWLKRQLGNSGGRAFGAPGFDLAGYS